MKVALFVGTRADLGPLGPVIAAVETSPPVELHLLCGVAFSSVQLRELVTALGTPVPPERVHQLGKPLDSVDRTTMLGHGVVLAEGFRALLSSIRFDCLVLLGDRWELLFLAPLAYLDEIPIVHIHGGEVTGGALDERVRHAVTKLADLHCAASADAAARIARMGEPSSRIRVTGAPGLDRLRATTRLDAGALSARLGRTLTRPVALFTYHPPTAGSAVDLYRAATDALRSTLAECTSVIVTRPGMDAGRDEVNRAIDDIAADHDQVLVVDALGALYPEVLASVDVVVGNSSSGIIEAGSVGIPAVNIGTRQEGRLRGANVIDAADSTASIRSAIHTAFSDEFRATARVAENPYGDGRAAERIVDAIITSGSLPRKKAFADAQEAL